MAANMPTATVSLLILMTSGNVWKTTNFYTTDTNGPTYVPLTDLGPSNSLNMGGLAVFALCITLWVTNAIPYGVTALLGIALLGLSRAVKPSDAYAAFGSSAIPQSRDGPSPNRPTTRSPDGPISPPAGLIL